MDRGEAGERRLLPVAVIDVVTGEPLMLAYADEDALRLTAETGLAHFYSRSRGSLWLKGASSGSLVRVLRILLDCDRDAAAYIAHSDRHVCHLGRRSCFHNTLVDRVAEAYAELLRETWPHAGRGTHPLASWRPPPSPLLAALASLLLAERLRGARPTAVLAPPEPPPMLALLAAQRLGVPLHLAAGGGAPESIGEEDRVAVVAPSEAAAEELAGSAEERGAEAVALAAIVGPHSRGWRGCSMVDLLEGGPAPGTCIPVQRRGE